MTAHHAAAPSPLVADGLRLIHSAFADQRVGDLETLGAEWHTEHHVAANEHGDRDLAADYLALSIEAWTCATRLNSKQKATRR